MTAQERLIKIKQDLEDVLSDITDGVYGVTSKLEGIKINDKQKIEQVVEDFGQKAYSSIARLIYKLDGE